MEEQLGQALVPIFSASSEQYRTANFWLAASTKLFPCAEHPSKDACPAALGEAQEQQQLNQISRHWLHHPAVRGPCHLPPAQCHTSELQLPQRSQPRPRYTDTSSQSTTSLLKLLFQKSFMLKENTWLKATVPQ